MLMDSMKVHLKHCLIATETQNIYYVGFSIRELLRIFDESLLQPQPFVA